MMESQMNPQTYRVNYKLNARKLGFLLDEMKVGDSIEFSLRKRISDPVKNRKIGPLPKKLNDGKPQYSTISFKSFENGRNNQNIHSKMDLRIKLINGRIYKCKSYYTTTLGNSRYGVSQKTKIVEVIDSPVQ